ncbi:MAG: phosphoglucomutase/phosphomannomutase PgmG [Alphaproteobacteria bacterium]
MSGYKFNPTILREYDIRGTIGVSLGEADGEALGRVLATWLAARGGKTVHVGYDGRDSSPILETALVKGLVMGGMEVTRIGLGATPMLYFSTVTSGADAGVMVTGSHNPPEYNGFKIMAFGKAFYGDDIKLLGDMAESGDFVEGEGSDREASVLEPYVARLAVDYDGENDLAVAWDSGNGSAGPAMERLVKILPGRHVLLNEKVDATFPNHHPDPTIPENLVQLQELVAREKLDFGVAFDGDGDRIGAVDGKGRILWGDQMIALLARDVLKEQPGATIIADVKASQVLFDEVARMGGEPLMWKTGHSLIKSKMSETNSPLAGEMSGHIFFADHYYGYDDGLYAAVRLLSVVANSGKSLEALRDELPKMINTPELRFPCGEIRKFEVLEEVTQRLNDAGSNVNDCDGVRVLTDDGWWLLRVSNTQDVLVARCESTTQEGLDRLKLALVAELEASAVEAPDF